MFKGTKNSAGVPKVYSLLLIIYSIIFLIATVCTIVSVLRTSDFLTHATRANALVVGTKSDSKGRRAPIVRFKTANGETLQLESEFYSSPSYKEGDNISVVYRTSNPNDWQIDDWIHLYFWILLSSIFMLAWAMAIVVTKWLGLKAAGLSEKREAA